ncbi:FAD-binding oxidoreductase [Actinomycetospora sp. TBRC 11914]|uniref:FAD-binding oxidoreductase n=1 Tax=Actinomycetospora sp. TBRC 11914 TaxID=2729387 RepID=UPI00145F9D35|nr:FAD-binding oxidoreductase [Actinomycetospora sp. TBRC 11914]NMO88219.1 FAD-binding oxidoreductase [Actinomycetospora sp. TBRC 11914]
MSTILDTIPTVFTPGTPGYDAARAGFDLSAIPTPDVAVSARDEADVVTAVRFAAERDLPVVVRTTGHGPVGGDEGGVLIDTRALDRVRVDPQRRTAVVGGGATWTPVLAHCAPAGLIPLCGSSPEVGVASYTTGGGLSPLGRRYGWAADRVRRIRLVTPDGEVRDVTAAPDPELFWAVRGGGSGFGVATELEFDLVPGDALYGGGLFLPGECAAELVAAFGRVTAGAPDALSLSVAFVSFPPIEAVPAPLRGRFVAHLRVTYSGAPEEAERLIAPLRAVAAPILDTVRPLPILEFGTIHGDPTAPQPVSCGGAVLPVWDDAAIEVLLAEVGASTPHMLELRHLGGALARPAAVPDAVGHRDAAFNVFTSAYPGPAFADAAGIQTAFYQRLLPWSGGRSLLNFTCRPDGRPVDARGAFDAATLARLQEVKAETDPRNLFRTGVTILEPASVS